MKRGLLIAYVIALNLACGVALSKPGWVINQKARLGLGVTGEDHIETMRAFHARGDAVNPDGATIFLGDSLTEGMPVAAVVPHAVNYGIGYQTSSQLLESMAQYESLSRAGRFYLNVGTNDIRDRTAASLKDTYPRILALLPAGKPLIWSAIIPRGPKDNSAVTEANSLAAKLCAARPGCVFIDTWKVFMKPDGTADASLYSDPVHPNAKGYRKWIEALRAAEPQVPASSDLPRT